MTKDLTPKDLQSVQIAELFPPTTDESRILIGCKRRDYSASLISRAVEDCNAQVLNLNVTSLPSELFDLVIDLRVNHRNAEAISRSLERYGYDVVAAKSSSPIYDEQMRNRANEVLRYLEV